jgi:hypothetical protein
MVWKLAIKMYAAGVATADNVANVIIPMVSKIIGITYNINATKTTSVVSDVLFQLSVQSTSQFAVNDARNILLEVGLASISDISTNTAGGAGVNCGQALFPGIPVGPMDRLYLHRLSVTNFTTCLCNLNIHLAT